jgi:hypothetical protein
MPRRTFTVGSVAAEPASIVLLVLARRPISACNETRKTNSAPPRQRTGTRCRREEISAMPSRGNSQQQRELAGSYVPGNQRQMSGTRPSRRDQPSSASKAGACNQRSSVEQLHNTRKPRRSGSFRHGFLPDRLRSERTRACRKMMHFPRRRLRPTRGGS